MEEIEEEEKGVDVKLHKKEERIAANYEKNVRKEELATWGSFSMILITTKLGSFSRAIITTPRNQKKEADDKDKLHKEEVEVVVVEVYAAL